MTVPACDRAPQGWECMRPADHAGSCALWPSPPIRLRVFRLGALLFAIAAVTFDLLSQTIVDVAVLALVAIVLAVLDVSDQLS